MFQLSKVKVPNGAVLACRREGVDVVSERNIINRLVMRDKLSFYAFFVYVPDGTGCIYRRGADHACLQLVPVERG